MPTPTDIPSIKAKLIEERAKLLESFKGLSVQVMMASTADAWSIKDILAHVANSERVNVKFARLIVEKDSPVQLRELAADYPDFKQKFTLDNFNAYMTDKLRAQSLVESLAALHATRAETLKWMDTLTPSDLERAGGHAVWGEQTVNGMFRILVIHDKMHRADIEKRKNA